MDIGAAYEWLSANWSILAVGISILVSWSSLSKRGIWSSIVFVGALFAISLSIAGLAQRSMPIEVGVFWISLAIMVFALITSWIAIYIDDTKFAFPCLALLTLGGLALLLVV